MPSYPLTIDGCNRKTDSSYGYPQLNKDRKTSFN